MKPRRIRHRLITVFELERAPRKGEFIDVYEIVSVNNRANTFKLQYPGDRYEGMGEPISNRFVLKKQPLKPKKIRDKATFMRVHWSTGVPFYKNGKIVIVKALDSSEKSVCDAFRKATGLDSSHFLYYKPASRAEIEAYEEPTRKRFDKNWNEIPAPLPADVKYVADSKREPGFGLEELK